MKLSPARRLCSHLSVGFAYASMTAGGEIPWEASAVFAVAWGVSLGFEGRLGSPALYTVLTAVAFLALVFSWLTGGIDLVVAASLFAAALAANRMLARRAPGDDSLLHLAALMMLAGGAALSADLLYGVCFAGFALSIAAALTLSHLERVAEESGASATARERLVSPRLMGSLAALSAAGLGGAVIVFFAFPRVTTGFYTRARVGPFGTVTGFSGQVRLDGRGMLKSDPRVVARIRPDRDPGTDRLAMLWRGKSLDRFDGHAWSAPPGLSQRTRRLAWTERDEGSPRWVVEVLPAAGTTAVFIAGRPTSVGDPRRVPPRPTSAPLWLRADAGGDVQVDPSPEDGYSYELRTWPALEGVELEGAGEDYPQEIRERFLQLPPGLDPRIPALARELTEGLADPYLKAKAIERELLTNFKYTTEMPGPQPDPLAHFLFARKRGHCEFFSSAMTVLARAAGIPARNVVGFFGGVRGAGADYFVLRAGDAHSWTEVYMPGRGFVAFDPTPPEGRFADPLPGSTFLMELLDRASLAWQRNVVELTLWDQLRAARTMLEAVQTGFDRLRGRTGAAAAQLLRIALGIAVMAAAIVIARPLLRRARPKRKAWREVPPRVREAVEIYRMLVRRLGRRGIAKPPGRTPRAWATEMKVAQVRGAGDVAEVVEWYLAARFSGRPVATADAARMRARIARL